MSRYLRPNDLRKHEEKILKQTHFHAPIDFLFQITSLLQREYPEKG